MPAILSAGIDSLSLKINSPMESDGVTPRDDLIGVKVWYSTTGGFVPPNTGTLAYDGTGLDISITGLSSGTNYYVRYALISEIEPDNYTLSDELTGTPVFETQTVDATPPPTPTGVSVTAGVGTIFISHDAPTYTAGRGHRRTHVFGLKTTPANTAAGYTFARAAAAGTIAQFTGNFFNFSSDPDTEWHIWLKWETNNGVLSETASGGNTGDTAKTSQDVSTLLSALTGKIATGQLATSLSSPIGTIPNLNSQYAVKVNTAGQIAGFGLASTTSDSGNATSEFGIQADKFWIAPPPIVQNSAPTTNLYVGMIWIDSSGTNAVTKYYTGNAQNPWSTTRQTVLPFTVVTTPQSIGGQTVNPGVYIDAAYIKDGTITNAKIGDATISAAKIGSVDATKITVNKLTASQINSNGLTIRDTAGNILLDASNSQLGLSLFVGTGSNKRLLSTVGAFASTPNTAYIGEFSSAPAFSAARTITSWYRISGISYITTSVAHGFVLGSKVTITGADATINSTYEIIEIPSSTTFKIVNTGADSSGTTGTASGFLYAENSVYKNTANGNSYILSGSTLAWSLFLEKGVKGNDGVNGITAILSNESHVFPASNAGAVSSYANSGTTIRVYEGATELTYSTTDPTPTSSWKVTAEATNITAGTIAAVANTVYAEMPALSAGVANGTDTSSIKYTITGKNAAGTAFTITKTQTFSKSKQGDKPVAGTDYTVTNGTSPLIYDIVTSAPVITKASPNAATDGTYSSITVQGKRYNGNVTSNYGWVTITANGDTEATTATDTASSAASLAPAANAGKSSYTIKMYNQATVSGATLLDTQTISVLFKGEKGDKPVAGTDYTVTNGTRGSVWVYLSGYTVWNTTTQTAVNTYFTNTYAGKIINDTVTVYGTNFAETRTWTGDTNGWVKITQAIDGNLLVTGTVTADKVATNTAVVGMKISSSDDKFVIDFQNKTISITV